MSSTDRAPKRNENGGAGRSTGSGVDNPYGVAMARAGRLLAARPRAEAEMRDRLERAGYAPEIVERVRARLTELGLLDDVAFARQWIEERSRRGRSGRVLLHELAGKGIAREVAEAVLAEAGSDEREQAEALAAHHLPRVASLPLHKQAARLGGMLARRGYAAEVVEEAVRAVLPPEGWD